jgi:hypothetical protein
MTVPGVADHALALSDEELARYRFLAEAAAAEEAGDGERAGIVAGSRMADDADIARWGVALDRIDALDRRPWVFTPILIAIGRLPG